jgi:hypothetical protein
MLRSLLQPLPKGQLTAAARVALQTWAAPLVVAEAVEREEGAAVAVAAHHHLMPPLLLLLLLLRQLGPPLDLNPYCQESLAAQQLQRRRRPRLPLLLPPMLLLPLLPQLPGLQSRPLGGKRRRGSRAGTGGGAGSAGAGQAAKVAAMGVHETPVSAIVLRPPSRGMAQHRIEQHSTEQH